MFNNQWLWHCDILIEYSALLSSLHVGHNYNILYWWLPSRVQVLLNTGTLFKQNNYKTYKDMKQHTPKTFHVLQKRSVQKNGCSIWLKLPWQNNLVFILCWIVQAFLVLNSLWIVQLTFWYADILSSNHVKNVRLTSTWLCIKYGATSKF